MFTPLCCYSMCTVVRDANRWCKCISQGKTLSSYGSLPSTELSNNQDRIQLMLDELSLHFLFRMLTFRRCQWRKRVSYLHHSMDPYRVHEQGSGRQKKNTVCLAAINPFWLESNFQQFPNVKFHTEFVFTILFPSSKGILIWAILQNWETQMTHLLHCVTLPLKSKSVWLCKATDNCIKRWSVALLFWFS